VHLKPKKGEFISHPQLTLSFLFVLRLINEALSTAQAVRVGHQGRLLHILQAEEPTPNSRDPVCKNLANIRKLPASNIDSETSYAGHTYFLSHSR
jgi:hypothetical protein